MIVPRDRGEHVCPARGEYLVDDPSEAVRGDYRDHEGWLDWVEVRR